MGGVIFFEIPTFITRLAYTLGGLALIKPHVNFLEGFEDDGDQMINGRAHVDSTRA